MAEGTTRHGALYWFLRHSREGCSHWYARHRRRLWCAATALLIVSFLFRASLQWLVLDIRRHLFEAAVLFGLLGLGVSLTSSHRRTGKAAALLCFAACGALVACGKDVYSYLSLYYRYQQLDVHDLTELPTTDFERIQPGRSIAALAHDTVSEDETPLEPDYIRKENDYVWSFAIEPAYTISRFASGVHALVNVQANTAAPSFSSSSRVPVHFETGERLLFGRNSRTATIRTFGLWRYLNDEPAEVLYLPDEHGEWVQVITLIHWRGLFFPYPVFGGVQIVRQSKGSLQDYPSLFLFGAGEWIPPDEVARIPFLRGQNVLPARVSRAAADSFRFQTGFFGPFPGYHAGDIRIPHLDSEVNPQPFVGFFRHENGDGGKLYHYFALEPADTEKQGLNTSVFLPADGSGAVEVYRHYDRGEILSGVSSVSTKVMESRKSYDWNRNRPVEHRPFIRRVDGVTRFLWLTTVVTARLGEEKGRFIAGSVPEVVLTDASCNIPVWVDAKDSAHWMATLEHDLGSQWRQSSLPSPTVPR